MGGVARVCLLLVVGVALACPPVTSAGGHGEAEWIQQGQYRNSVGDLCCGERDCYAIPATSVTVTSAGYLVRMYYGARINEVIPFDQAQPSPDGNYWICVWGGQLKCFFAPPGVF